MGGADFARAALLLKYPDTAKIFVSLGRQGNCTDKQDTSATTESHRYTEEGLMQYRVIQVNKTFFKKKYECPLQLCTRKGHFGSVSWLLSLTASLIRPLEVGHSETSKERDFLERAACRRANRKGRLGRTERTSGLVFRSSLTLQCLRSKYLMLWLLGKGRKLKRETLCQHLPLFLIYAMIMNSNKPNSSRTKNIYANSALFIC